MSTIIFDNSMKIRSYGNDSYQAMTSAKLTRKDIVAYDPDTDLCDGQYFIARCSWAVVDLFRKTGRSELAWDPIDKRMLVAFSDADTRYWLHINNVDRTHGRLVPEKRVKRILDLGKCLGSMLSKETVQKYFYSKALA